MTENPTISKAAPPSTSMDFAALREIGINHFEKMGTRLWTDFNLHDPGITILEVLCYAITDLGYRTNFPIEDIIASGNNQAQKKQFFSAAEILTCNPVTVNDFRKILIDLDGIKNAWLVKTQNQEMWIKISEDKQLQIEQPPADKETNPSSITLNGLYDVYIDLDNNIDHNDLDRVDDITNCAWRQLWKHRNLCEDFVTIKVVEETEFGIDAEIELCPDADVNKVAGDIYYYIQEFLTPTIQFYSFKEMYEERKKSCEEIFDGPVLCNGFIDDSELDKAWLRKEIYLSDLWQVIMDVCGVAGIRKLSIYKCNGSNKIMDTEENMDTKKKWCLQIDPYHKPRLNSKCSKIFFQKEFDCVYPDPGKVYERIALLQKLNQPRAKSQERPPLQAGDERNLEEYFTIQNEFPFTYKIGEGQVTDQDSVLRKAQVKQLKAYLLLFDELLANYLAILSRVKDLLSISQPEEHSYFYQTLYAIPGIQNLVKAANRLQIKESAFKGWESLKMPQDIMAALREMKAGTIFQSEKDFIYQLSLSVYGGYISQKESEILAGLDKNEEGKFFLKDEVKNDDEIPSDIRNIITLFRGEFFSSEKEFLKELYLAYFREKQKKYYSALISQLNPIPANEESWNEFVEDDKNDFLRRLDEIVENETRLKQRKNIFLDHLLARFGESFTDYVVKAYQEQCNCTISEEGIVIENRLLKNKAAFLQSIPELSSERGKGFNYKALDCGNPDVWDTINVAGLKKRVCKYLGYEDYSRKTLTCPPEFVITPYRIVVDGKVQNHRLRLQDKKGNILLDGVKDYYRQQAAVKDAKELKEQVLLGHFSKSKEDKNGYLRLYLKDKEDNNAMQSEMMKDADAENLRLTIQSLAFPDSCAVEGFHIVEHILLRPKDDDFEPLFQPVLVIDKLAEKWNSRPDVIKQKKEIVKEDIIINDPYSFWITVIAPDWLPQFKKNANAQNRFEQLVRRECPAHILVKFCWLSPEKMYQFESFYLQWLYENALQEPNIRELTEHVNDLVGFLKDCQYSIRDIADPCLSDEQMKE